MQKELLSSCCNAAILQLKESDETVCSACYHTTYITEQLEFDEVSDNGVGLHRIVAQVIFLIVLCKMVNLILFLLQYV